MSGADRPSIEEDAFFGRETELARLEGFLEAGRRLITLVGPPGMGKTRLAQRVIERRAGRGDASVFVDLATARTLSDLVHGVATALGIANRDLVDAKLGSALAESGASLVVLDNLEALVDLVAGELGIWLTAAPALRLIVTSRIRVGSRAETILEVGPLGHEAALALMDHTARLHHDSPPLPPEERRALSQLVDRLDGLPLALELAAARTRLLRPSQILERLDHRFELLTTNVPGRSRHTALEAALSSAVDALPGEAQLLFGRLAAFVRPFDIDGAEAVSPESARARVVELLEVLVDSSLLRRLVDPIDGSLRLGFYESIREFAALGVDLRDREDAWRSHADHVLRVGEASIAGEVGSSELAFAEIGRLHDEMAIAFERTLPVAPLVAARLALLFGTTGPRSGSLEAHVSRLRLVSEAPEVPQDLQARVALAAGASCFLLGAANEACEHLLRATALAESAGLDDVGEEARMSLMLAREWQGDHAEEWASTSLSPEPNSAFALRILGITALHRGDPREGFRILSRARLIALGRGEAREGARSLALGGLALLELGSVEEADRALSRAEGELSLAHDVQFGALTHHWRGLAALSEQRLDVARAFFVEARARLLALGDEVYAASVACFEALANLFDRRDPAEAARMIEASVALLRASRDVYRLTLGLCLLGVARFACGETEGARVAIEEASSRAEAARHPAARLFVELARGSGDAARARAAAAQGQSAAARRALEAATKVLADAPARAGDEDTLALASDARLMFALLAKDCAELRGVVALPSSIPSVRVDVLRVPRDVAFFELEGARVELARRRPLRLLLTRLLAAREEVPGRCLSTAELVAAGWPGERMLAAAGAHRLHVAIATLRKLGLGHRITRAEGGYLVPPHLTVEWLEDGGRGQI